MGMSGFLPAPGGGTALLGVAGTGTEAGLMALAEPREGLGGFYPLIPPGCLSDVL